MGASPSLCERGPLPNPLVEGGKTSKARSLSLGRKCLPVAIPLWIPACAGMTVSAGMIVLF